MATLVQFLAAGVKGAENGTATFLLRGTASSAAAVLYDDFERTAQPGTNVITLDANGAAEVYCSAYVDVTLRDSAGTILRTVTLANSDSVIEVRSDSFTGTDYDGSPANTAGEPVTLRNVLDRWDDSAGADDFKVLVAGVATNLSTAFAGFSGMFTNVKDPQFGAVGNGVTDDTTAILAATTAANGGIVFFPPGTYKITTLSLSGANINWVGSGAGVSIISGTTSTTLIALTNNTNTAWKNFSGLSFTSSGSYSRLFALEESQNVSFKNCVLDGTLCSIDLVERGLVAGLSKYLFTDCDFILAATTSTGILTGAATASSYISLKGCNFKVASGFTGFMLFGAGFEVQSCRFDASLVTSGTYHAISAFDGAASGKYVGTFTGNTFLDGGSSGYAFDLRNAGANCNFSESGNTFSGFTAPSALTDPGHIYDYSNAATFDQSSFINLGSRKGKQVNFSNSSSSSILNIECFLVAETVVIDHSNASDLSIGPSTSEKPHGLEFNVVVLNNSSGVRLVNFFGSGQNDAAGAVLVGAKAFTKFFTFLETTDLVESQSLGATVSIS